MNPKTGFAPLEREMLSEQVVRIIVDGLLSGRFESGTRLIETEIAQQLGISRSPVREALAELQKNGIVDRKPGRGATLREWSVRDVEELFFVRSVLEGCAARLAAERLRPRDLQKLESLVEEMRQAAEAEDRNALVDLDLAFHQTMWQLAENRLLAQVLGSLRLQFRVFMAITCEIHPNLTELWEIHQEIVDVFKSAGPQDAERTVRRYLKDTFDRMMQGVPARMMAPAFDGDDNGGSESKINIAGNAIT